jgi:hypothetical protein
LGADQTISYETWNEAVVAASRAITMARPQWPGIADELARVAVAGAVPHIEAAIREKIAAEIEAEKGHCIYGGNRGEAFDLGIHSAARVARGGSR